MGWQEGSIPWGQAESRSCMGVRDNPPSALNQCGDLSSRSWMLQYHRWTNLFLFLRVTEYTNLMSAALPHAFTSFGLSHIFRSRRLAGIMWVWFCTFPKGNLLLFWLNRLYACPQSIACQCLQTRVCLQMLCSRGFCQSQVHLHSFLLCISREKVKIVKEGKICWYFSFEVTKSCFDQIASYNRESDSSKESHKASSLLNLLEWLPWFCSCWHGLVKVWVLMPLTLSGGSAQAQRGLHEQVLQQGKGASVLAKETLTISLLSPQLTLRLEPCRVFSEVERGSW